MDKEDALRVLVYSVRKGDACSTTIRFATPFTLLDKREACIILNMIDDRTIKNQGDSYTMVHGKKVSPKEQNSTKARRPPPPSLFGWWMSEGKSGVFLRRKDIPYSSTFNFKRRPEKVSII
jgi:hypothetical protein